MILRQEDKKELVKIAKKFLQKSVEIWAYGSRVDGTAHETSDLDCDSLYSNHLFTSSIFNNP